MKILAVCLGNICRSPAAEGILRHLTGEKVTLIDSAGTGGWHVGKAPDHRMVKVCAGHGVEISDQRARQLSPEDFDHFDLIVAMDGANYAEIQRINPQSTARVIKLLDGDVLDPYYGDMVDFELSYRQIEEGCQKLIKSIGLNA